MESGICGSSAINAVMDGRQYYCAVQIHKLVCEVFQRARWKEFERTLLPDDTDLCDIKQSIVSLRENLNCENLNCENIQDVEKSPSYDRLLKKYQLYCTTGTGSMSQFWSSYDIVHLLLAFIRPHEKVNSKCISTALLLCFHTCLHMITQIPAGIFPCTGLK